MLKKKLLMVSALYSAFGLVSHTALAGDLPSGEVVKSGDINISKTSDSLRVTQTTNKGIIEWQDFSVGRNKSVHFQQPSKTASTLNRVTGDFTSEIAGRITATGEVFLVNPNGFLITKDGAINTQGFVASTLDITNDNFNKGNYTFSQNNKTGLVENQGNIDVSDGGFVALLGGAVKNTGTVNAHLGKVGFAGGERIVMSFGGNDFLRVEVPLKDLSTIKDTNGNPISNVLDINGTVTANGGMVQLTVATATKILRNRMSIGGQIQATTAVEKDGIVKIGGGDVTLTKDAKIVADKGKVEIHADTLTSAGSVQASGGNIAVSINRDATLNKGASFDVSGNKAGKIVFIAGAKKSSSLTSNANFTADSTKGTGGHIDITSKKGLVWLVSGNISANGTTQGGYIRVGGSFQGGYYNGKTTNLDKKAQNLFVNRWGDMGNLDSADDLTVETAVTVTATASTGTGGTVILWSDKTTDNAGKVDARGANERGGAVEISGKKDLKNAGLNRVHLNGGTLLLDPKDITFSTMTGPSESRLITQLNNGTDMVLRASNDIEVDRNINTRDDTGSSGKLTLIAGRSIKLTGTGTLRIKGGLTLIANASDFSHGDMTASERDSDEFAVITAGPNNWIAAGRGRDGTVDTADLIIKMQNGAAGSSNAKRRSGVIRLWKVQGGRISIVHNGTIHNAAEVTSKNMVHIRQGGKIYATGGYDAGDVAVEIKANNFVNNGGVSVFDFDDDDGRWLVWVKNSEVVTTGNNDQLATISAISDGKNFYGSRSGMTNYDFSQFNKSYNTGGANFQSNTTETSGTLKTGSGFVYEVAPTVTGLVASGAATTKAYNGNADAVTTNLVLKPKGHTGDVLTSQNVKFKVGSLSGDGNKYRDIKITVDRSSLVGKYRNAADNADQTNVGTNLRIKYSGHTISYTDGNNKAVYGISTRLSIDDVTNGSITKKTLTVTVNTDATRTYDGGTTVDVSGKTITIAGWVGHEGKVGEVDGGAAKTLRNISTGTLSASIANKNVSATAKAVSFTGVTFSTTGVYANYDIKFADKTITITKKTLTLKADDFNAITKTYDGDANIAGASVTLKARTTGLTGVETRDTVTLTVQDGALAFDNKNVNTNKRINVADKDKLVLGGTDGGNYRFTYAANADSGLKGTISKKALTVTVNTDAARTYDGGTTVDVSGKTITIAGWVGHEGKAGEVDGGAAKTLSDISTGTLSASVANKDASTTAKAIRFTGVTFKTNNVYANYNIAFASKTITINKKALTVTVNTDATREYDGGTTVDVRNKTITIAGWVGHEGKAGEVDGGAAKTLSDISTGTLSASVGNKNASTTAKAITFTGVNIRNTGVYANYTLAFAAKTITITKKALTVTVNTDATREYDGGTTVDVNKTITIAGWVGHEGKTGEVDGGAAKTLSDISTGTLSASVGNKDASTTAKTITFTGINFTTTGIYANYNIAFAAKTITINKKALTVTVGTAAQTYARQYDGTTNVSVAGKTITIGGWVGNEGKVGETAAGADKQLSDISTGTLSASVANKDASTTAKDITFGGVNFTTTGIYANYDIAFASKTITISKKALTLKMSDFFSTSKEYDGKTDAGVSVASGNQKGLNGAIGDDEVTVDLDSGAFVFTDKSSGDGKRINFGDTAKFSLDGAEKDNYEISGITSGDDSGLTGEIRKLPTPDSVKIFKSVMKTNSLTGSSIFSSRQRDFVASVSPSTTRGTPSTTRDTQEEATGSSSSGKFVVSLRGITPGSDYSKELAAAFSSKILNPERDKQQDIFLILD